MCTGLPRGTIARAFAWRSFGKSQPPIDRSLHLPDSTAQADTVPGSMGVAKSKKSAVMPPARPSEPACSGGKTPSKHSTAPTNHTSPHRLQANHAQPVFRPYPLDTDQSCRDGDGHDEAVLFGTEGPGIETRVGKALSQATQRVREDDNPVPAQRVARFITHMEVVVPGLLPNFRCTHECLQYNQRMKTTRTLTHWARPPA